VFSGWFVFNLTKFEAGLFPSSLDNFIIDIEFAFQKLCLKDLVSGDLLEMHSICKSLLAGLSV